MLDYRWYLHSWLWSSHLTLSLQFHPYSILSPGLHTTDWIVLDFLPNPTVNPDSESAQYTVPPLWGILCSKMDFKICWLCYLTILFLFTAEYLSTILLYGHTAICLIIRHLAPFCDAKVCTPIGPHSTATSSPSWDCLPSSLFPFAWACWWLFILYSTWEISGQCFGF